MKNVTKFPFCQGTLLRNFCLKASLLVFLFSGMAASAKEYQKEKISLNLPKASLEQVFEEIEKNTDYNFFYQNERIDAEIPVSIRVKNKEIEEVLDLVLQGTNIGYRINQNQIVLLPEQPKKDVPAKTTEVLQNRISGTVVTDDGIPLVGATVRVKESNTGTTADFDGNYSLVLPEGATTLVFSYVGFVTQEVPVEGRSKIDVVMQTDKADLDEVVIIGYGSSRRADLTGSVGTVEMEQIQQQAPTVNLDQALQGQVAGVYVAGASGQPGAPAKIRIRGTTSLMGSNQPLYVIDGIPVVPNSNIPLGGSEGGRLGDELSKQGLNTPIGNINTNDIESISILKDASAAAIYGSRAANGVIIINTKSGLFNGEPVFNLDVSLSTQSPKTLDVLNAQEFRQVWTTAVENSTVDNAFTQSVLDGSYFGNADTNWEDELTPANPVTTNVNASIRGGNEKTQYFSSVTANTQDGVFEGAEYDRYSFRLNLDTQINDYWDVGVNSNFSFTDQKAVDGGLADRMYIFRPDIPVFNEDGNYAHSSTFNLENPVALAQATNRNKTFLVLTSLFTELELMKGLTVKSLISLNHNMGNQNSFYPRFTLRGGWSRYNGEGDGYAQESRSTFTNLMWENTIRYNTLINEVHDLDLVAGTSFEESQNSMIKAWGEGFFNNVLTNVSSATMGTEGSSTKSASGLASYFGRANYNYDSRYLLSLSARVDGSSKFATENKYAFFPALAAGWRISEESFMQGQEVVNDLKLRASWGITGQQDFGPYIWRTLYEAGDYGNDPSIIISQLGNDRLKWEKSVQTDVGLDFTLFNHRVSGGLGYYIKDTQDAIFTAKTPGNTGFSTVIANLGNTRNEGVELQLSGDIVQTDDFRWTLGVNASRNRNELVAITDDFKDDQGYVVGFGGGGRLKEGSPIGLLYGYVADGIFQTQAEVDALNASSPSGFYQDNDTAPGDLIFKDINGPEGVPDGLVDTYDQTTIGNTQPDFFGGINNSLSYKGFNLTTHFTFSAGNDMLWIEQAQTINMSSTYVGENKTRGILNAWTPENPTNQPRIVYADPNRNNRISSYYVHDASYLRLKTLNLSYSFTESALSGLKYLDNASIFLVGTNLLTFTDYPGADPETTNIFDNDISAGVDNNRFPVAKVFTVGVKIGF